MVLPDHSGHIVLQLIIQYILSKCSKINICRIKQAIKYLDTTVKNGLFIVKITHTTTYHLVKNKIEKYNVFKVCKKI